MCNNIINNNSNNNSQWVSDIIRLLAMPKKMPNNCRVVGLLNEKIHKLNSRVFSSSDKSALSSFPFSELLHSYMNMMKISWAHRNTRTRIGQAMKTWNIFDMKCFCSLLFYSLIQLWGVPFVQILFLFLFFSKFVFKFERLFITNSYRSFSFVVFNWLATYIAGSRKSL